VPVPNIWLCKWNTDDVRIEPLGETAYVLRDLEADPYVVALSLELASIPGIEEIVPSMNTVGVYINPDIFDPASIVNLKLVSVVRGKTYTVPVVFDGPDLSEVAQVIGVEPEFMVKAFCGETYTVVAIGFLPGFPYLTGLPEKLKAIGRRDEPRIQVPIGSIGIAAGQAGIYPTQSPGGWNLIGATPLRIADASRAFFPLNPGDMIRFIEIEKEHLDKYRDKTILDYAND
jgi:KipI family sensor histidine kinase inhibitor